MRGVRAAIAADEGFALAHAGDAAPVFVVDGLEVDLARRVVRRDGEAIALTPTEYKILEHLVLHAGRVVTHAAPCTGGPAI